LTARISLDHLLDRDLVVLESAEQLVLLELLCLLNESDALTEFL
jgi:hypothetical protein